MGVAEEPLILLPPPLPALTSRYHMTAANFHYSSRRRLANKQKDTTNPEQVCKLIMWSVSLSERQFGFTSESDITSSGITSDHFPKSPFYYVK